MSNYQTSRPFQLRDFRPTDIPDFVEAINLVYPDEPSTVEQMEYWESSYPKDNPRLRAVAEWHDGKTIGFAACFNPFWMVTPGAYWLEMLVHPDYRRHGAGSALLTAVEPFAWQQSALRLWSNGREDHLDGVAFAEAHGYHRIGIRFESVLDLDTFDEAPFVSAFDRIDAAVVGPRQVAAELKVVGGVREDEIDGFIGELCKLFDRVARNDAVERRQLFGRFRLAGIFLAPRHFAPPSKKEAAA